MADPVLGPAVHRCLVCSEIRAGPIFTVPTKFRQVEDRDCVCIRCARVLGDLLTKWERHIAAFEKDRTVLPEKATP